MFSLIQLPNLRWIPKALSSSPTPQRPSPTTQLPRNTIQENVRYFILISPYCPSYQIITNRKRSNNRHPQRVFEISSQNCYLVVTSPTIEHHTITISTIYAFKNASSKNTPSTKSTEKPPSRNTFLAVLSSPLQVTPILKKIDQHKCSSRFTLLSSLG